MFLIFRKHFINKSYTIKNILGGIVLDNADIEKLLATISKMDKAELEKNIYKAQKILENSNIRNELNKKED